MGQGEILKILEEKGEWMTVAEIYENIDGNKSLIDRALNKLYKYGEIFKKQTRIGSRRVNIWKAKEEK